MALKGRQSISNVPISCVPRIVLTLTCVYSIDIHSIDINMYVTSAEHIKCALNDDFYKAVFDVV